MTTDISIKNQEILNILASMIRGGAAELMYKEHGAAASVKSESYEVALQAVMSRIVSTAFENITEEERDLVKNADAKKREEEWR